MRPIINSTFVTLDGVITHMDQWHFDFVDEETDAIALEQLREADALLMGRHTYEVYAQAWPDRIGDYPDRINAMPKYVASRSLTSPTWNGTTVLPGDLADSVRELKAADGGPILMHGFGAVAKNLVGAGLIDQLHLWFHPSLTGLGDAGDRLHTEGLRADFTLLGTRTLGNGVVVLSYAAR